MKYFKDSNNNVFGVDYGQEKIIKPEWVELTKAEIDAIKNPKKSQADKDKELEDIEWNEYLRSEEADKKAAWKLAGKPKYKGN